MSCILAYKERDSNMKIHGGDIYRNRYCIDFSVNMNPLGMPESVKRAAYAGVEMSECYPDVECFSLRQSIAEKENVEMEHIICGNGAAEIIYTLVNSSRPKHALVPVPSFFEYENALTASGCEIQYYFMNEKEGFQLGDKFIECIMETTDLVFLCNPNNPTGNLIEKEYMKELLLRCEKKDTLLVIDECFMDFTQEAEQFSMMDYCNKSEHLFILKAFTKLYAMPGLRLGYGVCSRKKLIEGMKGGVQPWGVSLPAQMAGVEALKETGYVADAKKLLEKEKRYLTEQLNEMKFVIYGSKANYIFFRTPDEKNISLWEECRRRGILIRDCENYRGLSRGFYRIAVKGKRENRILINVFKEIIDLADS